jgi:hypothetical protein
MPTPVTIRTEIGSSFSFFGKSTMAPIRPSLQDSVTVPGFVDSAFALPTMMAVSGASEQSMSVVISSVICVGC